VEHKTEREEISFEFLVRFEAEGETLFWIVAADEICVHHIKPEAKTQSTDWHYRQSAWKEKFKKCL
jgi:hypothetical protein